MNKLLNTTGIPSDNIMSATHTHTGPNVSGTWGWGDVDKEYCTVKNVEEILCTE